MPDDARFAVLWLNQSALEAVFDMEGAFNEALLSLTRDARRAEVIAAADRLLDRHGGLGGLSAARPGLQPLHQRRDQRPEKPRPRSCRRYSSPWRRSCCIS
ncbi:hypothetical protein ACFOHS_00465 [Jhaorihella thermophila]